MSSPGDLYTAPASEVDYELVKAFVLNAEAANLFSESLTFEAKEKRDKSNVAEAVAALGNTDGGVVLVGVKDKDATGEDRIVGVPKAEHDAVASNLHALIPEAMPEIITVAIPGGDRLVLVLRVDADAVPHPVTVSGKVLFRIPGHSVPADRRRILDLAARDQAAPGSEHAKMSVDRRPWQPKDTVLWQPTEIALWPKDDTGKEAQLRSAVLRVAGGLELPRRVLDRPWLGLAARQAALDALNNSPLRSSPNWFLTTWDTVEARATRPPAARQGSPAGHVPRPGRRLPAPGRPQALDGGRFPVGGRVRFRRRHRDGALLPRHARGDDHDRVHVRARGTGSRRGRAQRPARLGRLAPAGKRPDRHRRGRLRRPPSRRAATITAPGTSRQPAPREQASRTWTPWPGTGSPTGCSTWAGSAASTSSSGSPGGPALTSSGCPAWPSPRSSGAARLGRSQKISQGVANERLTT